MESYKLACFKYIYSEKLNIRYQKNKYKCKIKLVKPYLELEFNFNDLSFFETENELISSTENMELYNFKLT